MSDRSFKTNFILIKNMKLFRKLKKIQQKMSYAENVIHDCKNGTVKRDPCLDSYHKCCVFYLFSYFPIRIIFLCYTEQLSVTCYITTKIND